MFQSDSHNNKRIAMNTLYLYFRMAFLMGVSFFTVKILLDKLGVEDYGIYNVVGGLAGMFIFFSSSFVNASQRFLNIELGKGNIENASRICRQHFTLYCTVCIGVVMVAETVGVWFVYHKLVIPPERLFAALCIYQFFIVSLCATMVGIVFNSQIVAHEDMNVYSYIGIFEGVTRLLICYLITICDLDKLILYGALMCIVTLLTQSYSAYYCYRNYAETKIKFLWDTKIIKESGIMIGWNTWGTLVYAISDSGVNILLNMFFGPVVNAARAISSQVNAALYNFSSNFFKAINPQITKSYGRGDYDSLYSLFYRSSKYGFFLFWIFMLPILFSADTLLTVWLTDVPEYTSVFTCIILVTSLISTLNNPAWTMALAVGNLKKYMGIGSLFFLLIFPFSYIFLELGYSPISVFVITFVFRTIQHIVQMIILHGYVKYSYSDYFSLVIRPILVVISVTSVITYLLRLYLDGSFLITMLFCITSFLVSLGVIWFLGINRREKNFILDVVKTQIKKYF